jgi:phosphoglycolate phosphatase
VGDLPRLIVFDLDGTLVDSRQDLVDAANALVVERGGAPLAEGAIAGMVGEGAATLVRRALTAADLTTDEGSVARFLELYDERLLRTTRPYAGIPRVLQELSPTAPLAVLTNKPIAPARTLLEQLDLSLFFADVVGGDGPWPRKPDPASLRDLAARHHARPEQVVLVGDSRIDLETARAAGTAICLARYGFGYFNVRAEHLRGDEAFVDHPKEIPREIKRLLDGSSKNRQASEPRVEGPGHPAG